jgi:hypothetical protein
MSKSSGPDAALIAFILFAMVVAVLLSASR